MSLERRRQMIEPGHPQRSIVGQCALVLISRSGFNRRSVGESPLNLELMRLIDAQFLETPPPAPPGAGSCEDGAVA
jgi:putative transposase